MYIYIYIYMYKSKYIYIYIYIYKYIYIFAFLFINFTKSDTLWKVLVAKSDFSLNIRGLWIKKHIPPPLPCFLTWFIEVLFSKLNASFLGLSVHHVSVRWIILTLQAPTAQNGQTYWNNSSAICQLEELNSNLMAARSS